MTGHGEGQSTNGQLHVLAEARSINNRFLKVNVRCTDGFGLLDPKIEDYVRGQLKRGTVNLNVRNKRQLSSADIHVNDSVLDGYIAHLNRLQSSTGQSDIRAEWLLSLPGVLQDPTRLEQDDEAVWPLIQDALDQALSHLQEMREREGTTMAVDLLHNVSLIEQELENIIERSPQVIEHYQTRLTEKLQKLLDHHDVELNSSDIVREVGIFADRCDISEETVRLKSHLEQFRAITGGAESNGRKLDFVTQEMFRETNTIGSKANDAEIARFVVEIKTAIERIREMVQNIE